jgi:uncharacterized RDD family membrane protein YckC
MSNTNNPNDAFSMANNPYRASTPGYNVAETQGEGKVLRLASVGKRFLGWLIDTLVPLLFVVPAIIPMIIAVVNVAEQSAAAGGAEVEMDPASASLLVAGWAILILGSLALFILQVVLLVTRSQTLGKYFVNTQVVDFETGTPAGFLSCGVLRVFVNGLIAGLPCIGLIYFIVDSFYVLREDRRCIHDLIANTPVIDLTP